MWIITIETTSPWICHTVCNQWLLKYEKCKQLNKCVDANNPQCGLVWNFFTPQSSRKAVIWYVWEDCDNTTNLVKHLRLISIRNTKRLCNSSLKKRRGTAGVRQTSFTEPFGSGSSYPKKERGSAAIDESHLWVTLSQLQVMRWCWLEFCILKTT